MPPSLIQSLRQTRFPHNGQLGPRRYGLVQHRISAVGTAAPTHPVNQVPPPTKCSLFYPRNLPHHLVPEGPEGLDLVCATITFGIGVGCPLALALPEVMHLGVEQVGPLAELIFQEAFASAEGKQAVVDRLCGVVLVHFVRQAVGEGATPAGLLAGLVHPQLRHALTAVHGDPAHPWTLDEMAAKAGLSRSGFALQFKQTLGLTPGEHLARFRIATAQERLAQGVPLKVVAFDVGYGSSTALSRAFRELTGQSPREWLKGQPGRREALTSPRVGPRLSLPSIHPGSPEGSSRLPLPESRGDSPSRSR